VSASSSSFLSPCNKGRLGDVDFPHSRPRWLSSLPPFFQLENPNESFFSFSKRKHGTNLFRRPVPPCFGGCPEIFPFVVFGETLPWAYEGPSSSPLFRPHSPLPPFLRSFPPSVHGGWTTSSQSLWARIAPFRVTLRPVRGFSPFSVPHSPTAGFRCSSAVRAVCHVSESLFEGPGHSSHLVLFMADRSLFPHKS